MERHGVQRRYGRGWRGKRQSGAMNGDDAGGQRTSTAMQHLNGDQSADGLIVGGNVVKGRGWNCPAFRLSRCHFRVCQAWRKAPSLAAARCFRGWGSPRRSAPVCLRADRADRHHHRRQARTVIGAADYRGGA